MKAGHRYGFPLLILIGYFVLCFALHPWLGYLLDSDGVAYLTIARQVAEGHWMRGVNGLWSPLNAWILAPCIQQGWDVWMSAKVMNILVGAVVLIQVHHLFRRVALSPLTHHLLLATAAIGMAHHVYYQLFGDVWVIVYMLGFLQLCLSDRFHFQFWTAISGALLIALGFYAKTYALPFLFLFSLVYAYQAYRHGRSSIQQLRKWLFSLGILALLFISPWILALHHKYGEWTLSGYASKLNMSWQINSGKSFRQDIHLLIPPPYADSPSFWEDPVFSQDKLSTPFSSLHHFIHWTVRILYTCLQSINCLNELSACSLLLVCLSIGFIRKPPAQMTASLHDRLQTVSWFALLLPLGYLMMHIETRYIWAMTFPLMITGAWYWETYKMYIPAAWRGLVIGLFISSFIITPVIDIKNLRFKNKDLFEWGRQLKQHHIQGRLCGNANDAGRMWVTAYLSGSSFYTIERQDYTASELYQELTRYRIDYFLYCSENNQPLLMLDTTHFHPVCHLQNMDVFSFRP